MGNQSPAVPRKRMRVGINYMWGYDKYGLYFGPHWRYGEAPREQWMDSWLEDFENNLKKWKQELRVDVVRIFLLCNLQNFGNVDKSGKWKLPPSVDPRFTDHFERMLAACLRTEVQIVPSLVDFGIGAPELVDENRCSVVNDRIVRDMFYTQALVPFLEISKKDNYRSRIYAWEIMNEPSWLEGVFWPKPGGLPKPIRPRANHWELWEFLKKGIDLVAGYSLPSTVGHRFYADLSRFPTGTIPQFHYYPNTLNEDPSHIPPYRVQAGLDSIPHAFVGEFAAGIQGSQWLEAGGRDAPGPRERTRERLLVLDRLGYRVGMIWPDESGQHIGPGNDPKISSAAADGIMDYWRTQ